MFPSLKPFILAYAGTHNADHQTQHLIVRAASHSAKTQGGSMLVMALFVIVVFGLLAATMSSLLRTSSDNVIYEVYGLRAKQAAQAGIQRLALSSLPLNAAPALCNQTILSPSAFSQIAGLTGCQYAAQCNTSAISFNGDEFLYFRFTSTGTCQIDDKVTSRTISVDAMQER